MAEVTLKQLRYFESLARHKHFGKAASACFVTQPALSMQIRELEHNLGAALLERHSKRLELTRFGEEFLRRATEILRSAEELGELARTSESAFSGRLRMGIIPTIAPYLLPAILTKLNELHTGLDIHVRETLTQKLVEELNAGKIDCAVVALPISEPALQEVALFEEEFVLVRSIEEDRKAAPSTSDLRYMKLLLLEEGHCFRDQALSYCNMNSGRPREVLDGSSLSTLVQMVGAGLGVTLIPEMAVPVETRAANVSIARLGGQRPSRTIGMIWRKASPHINEFAGLADVFSDIGQSN